VVLQRPKRIRWKTARKTKVQGAVHEAKGVVKDKLGRATHNPALEHEGADEKVAGRIQKKVEDVEKVFEK
jgi:uncharacterized protein YjbJ (UPF0337 family)